MPKLARAVVVYDDKRQAIAFGPGDEPPDWAADQITNPRAWDTHPLNRLEAAGATRDELQAFETAWAQLTEEEQRTETTNVDDVTVKELREQLVQIRQLATEKNVSVPEAIAMSLSTPGEPEPEPYSDEWLRRLEQAPPDATPESVGPRDPGAPDPGPVKPLEQMNKDELVDEARRRNVDPSGRKDQLLTRLQQQDS